MPFLKSIDTFAKDSGYTLDTTILQNITFN